MVGETVPVSQRFWRLTPASSTKQVNTDFGNGFAERENSNSAITIYGCQDFPLAQKIPHMDGINR